MRVKLESFLEETSEKTTRNNQYPVLTSSKSGLYLQSDYFNKQVASTDNTGYKVIRRGEFTYRAMSDTGEFFPNMLECADIGIVSPAYPVFRITKPSVIVPEYLKYFFKSDSFQFSIASFAQGSTRTSIKYAKLKTVTIELPAITDQKHIIAVLNKTAAIIEKRKQQLSELDGLVKARFVEMFELHLWPTYKASTFMDDMRNGVSPSNAGTHKARVLTLSAITQGSFDRSSWKEGDFDSIPSEDKRVSACDFYMCRGNGNRNLVGSGVYSKENLYDLVFPDTVIAARVDTTMVRLPFLCEAWKRPSIRSQIESGARTTNGTFKINQKVIANIDISIPPIELQDSFVAFVEQTDKSKAVVQKALDEAQTLFDSLMQQYFG